MFIREDDYLLTYQSICSHLPTLYYYLPTYTLCVMWKVWSAVAQYSFKPAYATDNSRFNGARHNCLRTEHVIGSDRPLKLKKPSVSWDLGCVASLGLLTGLTREPVLHVPPP